MKLVGVYVGKPKPVPWEGKDVVTAIFKSPVDGPVKVRTLNIDGDEQADLEVHGGTDKAVYAYGLDAYPWWRKALKKDHLPPGSFGENLTFSRLVEREFNLGDIYTLGSCRLQVCQPRFPCSRLGIKFGDMGIIKTFLESGRPGIYFRVVGEGELRAGDTLALAEADPEKVSVMEIFDIKLSKTPDAEAMRRVLKVKSLNEEWRLKIEKKLAALSDTAVKTSPI